MKGLLRFVLWKMKVTKSHGKTGLGGNQEKAFGQLENEGCEAPHREDSRQMQGALESGVAHLSASRLLGRHIRCHGVTFARIC